MDRFQDIRTAVRAAMAHISESIHCVQIASHSTPKFCRTVARSTSGLPSFPPQPPRPHVEKEQPPFGHRDLFRRHYLRSPTLVGG